MNTQTFLRIQTTELQRLWEKSANDPILGPQLRERLEDAQRELEQFLKTPATHQAELRLAFSDRRSQSLSAPELKTAADLLDREVEENDIQVDGVFRGLTQDTGYFDVRAADGKVISGTVADELNEEDMERISKLTNRPCVAEIHETIMHKVEGPAVTKYVLMNARKA